MVSNLYARSATLPYLDHLRQLYSIQLSYLMIWVYLKTALVLLLKLFYYPEKYRPKRISKKDPCPCCGNNYGMTIQFRLLKTNPDPHPQELAVVTCGTCRYAYYREPVSKLKYTAHDAT